MLPNFRFHHIGYATGSIADTASAYLAAGYHVGEVVRDAVQRVNVCFLSKEMHPCIELVEPTDEKSSVNKILKNNGGTTPYHICYEVDDIDIAFDELTAMGYTPLFRPVEAVALDNKQICYFHKREVGFIEIVNKL
jgi:methylmalonyl-CoA/ethylmalonyl-CoA epimerase